MRAFNPYPALTLIKTYDSIYGSNQEGFCIVGCWAAATDVRSKKFRRAPKLKN